MMYQYWHTLSRHDALPVEPRQWRKPARGGGRRAGKAAIVTGAATGIGEATARLYADEGAKVVVADIRAAEGEALARAIREAGGDAIFIATDVAQSEDLERPVSQAEHRFGRLDILTANAGVLGLNPWPPLHHTRPEAFRQVMAIHFYGGRH